MTLPDDTPRHWVRDLVVGAAVVLALAQTLRIFATQAEVAQLKAQLSAAALLRVVYKSEAPLVRLVSIKREGGMLDARLDPLRAATLDIFVLGAKGEEIAPCRKVQVTAPLLIHCAVGEGAVTVSVVER